MCIRNTPRNPQKQLQLIKELTGLQDTRLMFRLKVMSLHPQRATRCWRRDGSPQRGTAGKSETPRHGPDASRGQELCFRVERGPFNKGPEQPASSWKAEKLEPPLHLS